MDALRIDSAGGRRRVKFASRCQVIPYPDGSEHSTAVNDDAVDQYDHEKDKKKARGRLSVFRSLASSSSIRHKEFEDENQGNGSSSSSNSNNNNGTSSRQKLTSQERKSRAMSPSLPINKNPRSSAFQGETLRRKLISPPPPILSPSASPIDLRLGIMTREEALRSSPLQVSESLDQPKASIAKPMAIRKPLSLGPKESDDERVTLSGDTDYTGFKSPATLKVPMVVSPPAVSPSDEAPARAVLKWSAEGELDEGGEEENDEEVLEEDLNGECVCPDCESKMTAALSDSYETPWTRSARKKYLADRRQAQIEGMKKRNSAIHSTLRKDGEDLQEASTLASNTTAREIKADEVDAKKGDTKVEVVPILADPAAAKDLQSTSIDAVLKEDTDGETTIRKDEERSKRNRSEAKQLSNDISSGLYTGGGGARAMMRQLEEAERQEKRASVQRTKSLPTNAEAKKQEVQTMGAVKDTLVRPFTSPRRLSDGAMPTSKSLSSISSPSPPQEQLQSKKKSASPSMEELAKARKRDHRLSTPLTPSMLIRRELTLGIPIHANHATPRSSWPTHPPTRAVSPRLSSPTTLEDIAEIPSRTMTEVGSGQSTPRRANTVGHASSPLARSGNTGRAPASMTVSNGNANGNGNAKVKRATSLSGKSQTSLYNQPGHATGLGLNLTQHAQVKGSEGRNGSTKSKTRIIFKDLVARIKG